MSERALQARAHIEAYCIKCKCKWRMLGGLGFLSSTGGILVIHWPYTSLFYKAVLWYLVAAYSIASQFNCSSAIRPIFTIPYVRANILLICSGPQLNTSQLHSQAYPVIRREKVSLALVTNQPIANLLYTELIIHLIPVVRASYRHHDLHSETRRSITNAA